MGNGIGPNADPLMHGELIEDTESIHGWFSFCIIYDTGYHNVYEK